MKLMKILLSFCTLALLALSGCVKDDEFFDMGSGEQSRTFLKILEAPKNSLFFEPFSGTRNVQLMTLRRNASDAGQSGGTLVVNVTIDTAAIRAFNLANNENYKLLPDSLYTIVGNDFTKTGNLTYQATFAPGEFSKEFDIMLNGSKWNLTEKYMVPFSIQDPGGVVLSSGLNKLNTFISIKNKWDGIYEVVSGTVTRYIDPTTPANDALSGSLAGNPDVHLVTSGTNTLTIPSPGNPGALYWANGSGSQVAGINGTMLTIDPVTNLVTMSSAGNATLTNWAGKENRYDPATKTFYLGFIWNPTSSTRTYEVVLKYKGPR